MTSTRYLRPRATQPIDDATLAATVAAVIGPPGLVRYPPRSPALFPVPAPTRFPPPAPARRWPGILPRIALGGGGLLLAWVLARQGSAPSRTTAPVLMPTTTAIAPAVAVTSPSATATATVTALAPTPTVTLLVATATSVLVGPLPTRVPTVRPVPPTLPPALPMRIVPTATTPPRPPVPQPTTSGRTIMIIQGPHGPVAVPVDLGAVATRIAAPTP